jgi:RecA-family ATPase
MERVVYPRAELGGFRLDAERDIQTLRETIAMTKPDLVIVDSLAGGLPSGDHTKAAKRAFRNLRALATQFRVAVLVVQHARKMPAATRRRDYELDDIRGSSELSFFARSVLGLDEPDCQGDPGHLRIRHLKSNFSVKQPPIGMRVEDYRPVFTAEPPTLPGAPTAMSRAMELLPEWLSDGSKPATWIKQACKTAGISYDTCKKAKTLLNIQSEKRKGKWFWVPPTP